MRFTTLNEHTRTLQNPLKLVPPFLVLHLQRPKGESDKGRMILGERALHI